MARERQMARAIAVNRVKCLWWQEPLVFWSIFMCSPAAVGVGSAEVAGRQAHHMPVNYYVLSPPGVGAGSAVVAETRAHHMPEQEYGKGCGAVHATCAVPRCSRCHSRQSIPVQAQEQSTIAHETRHAAELHCAKPTTAD